MDVFLQIVSNILIPASVFALLIAGFSLIYSVTRVIHLAHGGVAVFAGYLFYVGFDERHFPVGVAFVVAVVGAVTLGVLMNALVYERLRNRESVSSAGLLISALSLLILLHNFILLAFGSGTHTLDGLSGTNHVFGPVLVTDHEIVMVVMSAVLLLSLWVFLKWTRTGKALRAVADHETVAEIVGIPAKRMRHMTFALASALAGVAGSLFAIEYGLEPSRIVFVSVRVFYQAVVGGLGSVVGATVGSLFMQAIHALAGWYVSIGWADVIEFAAMLGVLLIWPSGLFGKRSRNV